MVCDDVVVESFFNFFNSIISSGSGHIGLTKGVEDKIETAMSIDRFHFLFLIFINDYFCRKYGAKKMDERALCNCTNVICNTNANANDSFS